MPRLLRLLLPAAAIAAAACVADLEDMVVLQQALLKEYPGTEVMVSMESRSELAITFRNSDFGELDEPDRQVAARSIGRFVLDHYPAAPRLESLTVAFGTRETAGPITITRDEASYSFTPEQLEDAPRSSPDDTTVAPSVSS